MERSFLPVFVSRSANQERTQGGDFGANPPPLNLLSYKNVITYGKGVCVHFLLV